MFVKSGNTPACAACKYQRRRCTPDCILAPYFPASETKAFQNAHRLFGVANIVRILKQLTTEEQKAEAMKSIKYEADARERFPVTGCYGMVLRLQSQLEEAKNELREVYQQLNTYRRERSIHNHAAADISSHSPLSSYLQLGVNHDTDIQLSNHTGRQTHQSLGSEIPFLFSIDEEEYDDESHHHLHLDQNKAVEQTHYGVNGNNNNSFNNFTAPSDIYQNFQNEMFFDKQSYIQTKDASESSSVTSFVEFQQPTSENK